MNRVLTAALLALPLAAAPVLASVVAPVSPAAAAPAAPAPAAERPVTVDLTRFDPRTVAPGGTVTLAGTLTNTGSETLTDLGIRLQRSGVVTTRADLLATDADADLATVVGTPFSPLPGALAPGDTLPFTVTATTADLALGGDGVYPLLLNLNGTGADGGQRRVGEIRTHLVQQTAPPATATAVAWLWPLTERSHRDAAGDFTDDGLAGAVSEGGRLDRALAVVERLPAVLAPGAPEPTPVAPVTLAVDPALVEELSVMAEGPYDVAGEEGAGTGTEAAGAWLERLRAAAADHPVVALPYGDVDADALQATGLTDALTRSLPDAPTGGDGTDGDPGATDVRPAATDASPGPAGAALLTDVLGVAPRTDLAWAPGGALRPDTLTTLRAGGVEQVVVASTALSVGDAVLGVPDGGAAARATVPAGDGPVEALVVDAGLSSVVDTADTAEGGPRVAEQRYLAELVLVSQQAGTDPAGQSVLVAPGRDVDPDPEAVAAMIADTALPGLRPASLTDLASGPVADAGTPLDQAGAGLPDPSGLGELATAAGLRDDLAGAVVGEDPATALASVDAALARVASAAWRDDPAGFLAAARDVRETVGGLRHRVTLVAPADGTYSLASSDAPLVLTVQNDLPFAVRVLPQVRTRDNVGLTIGDLSAQELAPGQRTTLEVPTQVRQSGRFAVTASLTTPGGGTLGDDVAIQVRSTAYGTISLSITIGAAVLLGLLFLRRGVLFLRRRGRAEEELPDGAGAAWPPSRSPV
ncbi:hypothetical protein SAMN05660657_04508 [Geodermatophilus amargosae]|uniref:Glycoprotein n=1 Tax=Geodermatophilus amargosae TaxID=1296565 RepID=A0A1I7CIB8_9ACTN|nr:DUF6049 family protein [Geodermatophilus amargosae]SFT99170.1 hypothetical protein SAMN05660657_04508 [Geodermatophilus amargosae]